MENFFERNWTRGSESLLKIFLFLALVAICKQLRNLVKVHHEQHFCDIKTAKANTCNL